MLTPSIVTMWNAVFWPCFALRQFISQLTFFWFTPLVILGWKRALETSDLLKLSAKQQSEYLISRWKSKIDIHYLSRKRFEEVHASVSTEEQSTMLQNKSVVVGKQNCSSPSLVWKLFVCFKLPLLLAVLLRLASDLLQFANPMLLKFLIRCIQDHSVPRWVGYACSTALLLASTICTLLQQHYFHQTFNVGLGIRCVLMNSIFEKLLVMSSFVQRRFSSGVMVNMLMADTQRFMELTPFLNMLWSCPLQILVSLYLLWEVLGPSVLAGVLVMLLLVPINGLITKKNRQFHMEQTKLKDERMKLMAETFRSIKAVKLYVWEDLIEAKIHGIRAEELRILNKAGYVSAVGSFIWISSPFLVAAFTFGAYVWIGAGNSPLTAEVAFVSLALFNILRLPMAILPTVISLLLQANVSNARLKSVLFSEELTPQMINSPEKHQHISQNQEPTKSNIAISVVGDFAVEFNSAEPLLKSVDLSIAKHSLVAIVGQVASGKTALLNAILGELEPASDVSSIYVADGNIAYVPQEAWILCGSLKDNIVFGSNFNKSLYRQVLKACALQVDIEQLPSGDETVIGEKGANLSGGQRQRVSLARAAYQNAEFYLFDDPLSAVDVHVGKQIFDELIGKNGLLRNKTRVFVTNALSYLKRVDQIVLMDDGEVSEFGSYEELLRRKGSFAQFIESYLEEVDAEEDEDPEAVAEIDDDLQKILGVPRRRLGTGLSVRSGRSTVIVSGDFSNDYPTLSRHMSIHRTVSRMSSRGGTVKRRLNRTVSEPSQSSAAPIKVSATQETAEAQQGKVKAAVYLEYIRSAGILPVSGVLILLTISNVFSVGSNILLAQWSYASSTMENDTNIYINDTNNYSSMLFYLSVYAGLGLGQSVFVLLGSLLLSCAMVFASAKLHKNLLWNLLRSPISFFNTTLIGQLLSRSGKDIDTIDNIIPANFTSWILCVCNVISTLVLIVYSAPLFATVIPFLVGLYYFIQEVVAGCSSIRAYARQSQFAKRFAHLVDQHQQASFSSLSSNRWLAIGLESVGNVVVFFASIFAIFNGGAMVAGLAGLAVSSAMLITQTLSWAVRMNSDLQSNITSVERVMEYSRTPTEANWFSNDGLSLPTTWPSQGCVSFLNFSARYGGAESYKLVLKNITLQISAGEKIGIVGRSGAGKSSLALALFRLLEPESGKILIDDKDIASIGLHDLRSRITIIPQEPMLLSGDLRSNLSPDEQHSDDFLWSTIEALQLKEVFRSLSGQLSCAITEGGENLSVGQRQLVCLVRALLRKSKIVVFDEATASLDFETDELVQKTVEREFADCTMLIIAHRIKSVMKSSRIIVMDNGSIAEVGNPNDLLADSKSLFHAMAKESGLVL